MFTSRREDAPYYNEESEALPLTVVILIPLIELQRQVDEGDRENLKKKKINENTICERTQLW